MTTYNTGNPVPSTDARDFLDNVQNLDDFSNGPLDFYADRLGVSRQSLQGIRNASQYQILGPYGAGLEFTSYNQVFAYSGEFYAPGAGLALPYTTDNSGAPEIALFRPVGDAILRQELANSIDPTKGSALVGFVPEGVGAAGRTVQSRLREQVSVKDFGAVGDGVADDTAAIQAAIDAVAINQGFQTTLGPVSGGYVSNVSSLFFPRGLYKLSVELNCPSYFKVDADNAVIIQTDQAKDIFSGIADAYQWEISGVHFSGGRHHANLQNSNIDVTRWTFTHCTFSLSADFAVKTFPTGGATSHLSANLTIKQCAFYKPKKVLLNYCDSAIIEDCWVFVSKDNFSPSTPVFENGSLTADGYPNLYLKSMFGVPVMGTQGVDRLANVRWCDLFKGSIDADTCRFGGEFGGMPVVYNMSVPATTYPYRGNAVTIKNSECFAGPSAANDSGIVSLQGQIPQRICISNNSGPLEVPYITNAGAQIANIATYFSDYQTASGQKIYEQFQFEIKNNSSLAPNGVVYGERVPAAMRPYCNNFRHTKIRRNTTQVITNGFASNIISFNTVDIDTQGGFDISNPTRIALPPGSTRMRVQVHIELDGGWTGNTLRAALVDSALTIVAGQGFSTNSNADNTLYTLSADVDGTAGAYWHVEIKQNSAGSQNVVSCKVTSTSLDYIG